MIPRMAAYFDFTVSLQDVLPRPWRRFLIPASATFATLHSAIQDACGWANSHLYNFRTANEYDREPIAGLVLEDDEFQEPMPDAKSMHLARYFGSTPLCTTCLYIYDYGDNWTHDVQLNDVVKLPERFSRRLLGGEHAFPPDDCGGPPGYPALQEALRTGRDPEELLEWARSVWGWTGVFDLATAQEQFEPRPGRRNPRKA